MTELGFLKTNKNIQIIPKRSYMRDFLISLSRVAVVLCVLLSNSGLAADRGDFDRIADDASFKTWVEKQKQISNPDVEAVQYFAEQLTWGEAKAINNVGGVAFVEVTSGCPHKCIGCVLRCDLRPGMKRMTWENFQRSIQAISGLQTALNEIAPKQYTLISPQWFGLYYDSDPMNDKLIAANGQRIGPRDLMRFTYEKAHTPVNVLTAGWVPTDSLLEESARTMAMDLKTDKAPYLRALQFEIKPVTKPFLLDVKTIMKEVLAKDPGFMKEFGDDFHKYGLDFAQYSNREEALKTYNRLAKQNFDYVIARSKYFQDRIANLKVLLNATTAADARISVAFYDMDASASQQIPDLLHPFTDDVRLARLINEQYLNGKLDAVQLKSLSWENTTEGKLVQETVRPPQIAVIMKNGSIMLATGNSFTYPMAQSENPHERSMAHQPKLFPDDRPAWQIASDRLDTTGEPYLSEREMESIRTHLQETNSGLPVKSIRLGNKVRYLPLNGKPHVPVVEVQIGKKKKLFEFDAGTLLLEPRGFGINKPRSGILNCLLESLRQR